MDGLGSFVQEKSRLGRVTLRWHVVETRRGGVAWILPACTQLRTRIVNLIIVIHGDWCTNSIAQRAILTVIIVIHIIVYQLHRDAEKFDRHIIFYKHNLDITRRECTLARSRKCLTTSHLQMSVPRRPGSNCA